MEDADLERRFSHHPPSRPEVVTGHRSVREMGLNFARWINVVLPNCDEKTNALDALDLAVMHANAGIARTQLEG